MAKIGEYRLKIYELLYNKPICEYAETNGEKKEQNVLIIGNGWAGNEAFKASFWAGQSLNSELNITVASKNALAYKEQVLSTEVLPSLQLYAEQKHYANLCFTNINIEAGGDESGLALLDFANKKYNYVIISLGDAENNFICALELLSLMKEAKKNGIFYTGKIIVNVFHEFSDSIDEQEQELLISEGAENDIEVHFFGQTFVDMENELERVARNINFSYEMKYDQRISKSLADERFDTSKVAEFVDSPFDYEIGDLNIVSNFIGSKYAADSSYAAAVHIPVKLAICREFNKEKDTLETLKDAIKRKSRLYKKLIALEHRRWNAYMVMRGYRAPSEQEEVILLYQGSNTHQDKERLLHICLCDCGEKGVLLEDDFDRQYRLWKEKKCPKTFPSELDRASLRCHELTTMISRKLDVKKIANDIEGDNIAYVNLRRTIDKLMNDEENSLVLYSKAFDEALHFAHSISVEEAEKIKTVDRMLAMVKIRNARMDFLSLDAQLIEMIPFSLWYGNKYRTVITISDGIAVQDVIVPTLFCATNAIFIGKNMEGEKYQQSVTTYFQNRGAVTTPQFVSLTEWNIDSVYTCVEKQVQEHGANEVIINCVLHKNFDVLLAVGMLMEKYPEKINAVQYLPNKGIVSFSKDKNIGVGLDNKSYSIGEFISLLGACITNEYNTLYDYEQCEALFEVFRDFSNPRRITKENGGESVFYLWATMATLFSENFKDTNYDEILDKEPTDEILFYQGKFSTSIFENNKVGKTLKGLQEYKIIQNYCETVKSSFVEISFEYRDVELISILEMFELDNEKEDSVYKLLKFIPSAVKGGLKIANLKAKNIQLFQTDESEEQVKQKKVFLHILEKKGFIHDLTIHSDGTTTFVFKDEATMALFKKQGSVFEMVVYYLLRESGMFDDVETGVKIAWDFEEKTVEQLFIEQLNELDAEMVGYQAYVKMRKELYRIPSKLTENEIDVIAIRGMNPIFISCKTGRENKIEWIYEIASIAEHFMSTGVMAVSNDFENKSRNMFRERAKQMQVALWGTETLWDLERLREALKIMIK